MSRVGASFARPGGEVRFDKLLILDLDETLVHITDRSLARKPDFRVMGFPAYKRPGVDGFLATCREWFQLAVWTSATARYAAGVVRQIFGDPHGLAFLWTRERCVRHLEPETGAPGYIKDLRKVRRAGWDLSRVLIVDDTAETARRNLRNAVIVSRYTGEPEDDELPALLGFLESLGTVTDVREAEKHGWRAPPGAPPAG